ncbi:cysteine desulfurase [Rothia sp. HMSC066H02]|uniref:cysteine desulfurase family protein n=1 Tax=unclassified Rothia (in: high G+C Gram-positive bacteria) TaxID=2689056 RepID=UPI0008A611E3|nr:MULTISPECIES: cysteine desulfurase family protein [unclassified Rothia (in: high G+C Gram-positive bacteria)]OFO97848.1 cysteine desulfurase [Rothia sp. HMSC065D09]OFP11131.1 cysteine desulfurase [Rothia sp. HMSC066H02]
MSAETNRQNGRVYLDHAATTDVLPAAIDAMVEQMRNGGNPSSLHAVGRDARATVEYARERIARAVGADPAEVIFTSGGTEADNLAVKGIYWKRREEDSQRTRILVSSIEHHAVEETCEWLEKAEGAQLEWIPVDEHGSVNPQTVRELIEKNPEDVALVTVMWANNEVGTVQPIPEIAAIAAEYGIPVHSDAVQAFGAVPIDFHASRVATLAISGHKIGGPMGIGALVATRAVQLTPVLHGGGQERSVRSGTIDAPAIAGFAEAAVHSVENLPEESARIAALRNELIAAISALIPQAHLSGENPLTEEYPGQKRLPGNAHFTFENAEGDTLLFLLDMQGISSSTGSACNAGVTRPSHVLMAMGMDEDTARSAQRFTLGHSTTGADIARLIAALPAAYEQAAKAGLSSQLPDASRWH